MPKLTETIIESAIKEARATGKERFEWEDKFGIRVKPSGVATFIIQYRPKGSPKSRRIKVGRWPRMKVEPARRAAAIKLREVDAGGDPVERERQEREARNAARANILTRQAARFAHLNY